MKRHENLDAFNSKYPIGGIYRHLKGAIRQGVLRELVH